MALLNQLPKAGDSRDASPGALLELRQRAEACAELAQQICDATTPEPLRPTLTRALIDAWAMTSLDEHPGRPDIQPWLRGWVEDEPQTSVIWRHHLPVRQAGALSPGSAAERAEIEAFLEAAPPHLSEVLETESGRVADWLKRRVKALLASKNGPFKEVGSIAEDVLSDDKVRGEADRPVDSVHEPRDVVALLLRQDGGLEQEFTLKELGQVQSKQLTGRLANKLLVVDARLGGLKDGLLDSKEVAPVLSADSDPDWGEQVGFRVRLERSSDDQPQVGPGDDEPDWQRAVEFPVSFDAEGAPQELLVVEHRATSAQTEDARSLDRPQTLAEHQSWTECKARNLATRLGLHGAATEALAVAALLHDEGKRAERWQRAFKAQRDAARYMLDRPLAKTRGPIDQALLDGYRHEFGSLPHAQQNPRFQALAPEWQDLVLHLVAAHHGQARPVIATSGCDDAPPSALAVRAQEVALRYARLQRRWGPWGLAWWEALLRAADQQASRENDQRARPKPAPKAETV